MNTKTTDAASRATGGTDALGSDAGGRATDGGARPEHDVAPGDVLGGRYSVQGILGVGGCGQVVRAVDAQANTALAMKILLPSLAANHKWRERLAREVTTARLVTHRHACRVFDLGELDGRVFLTMELAEGGSVAKELAAEAAGQSEAPSVEVRLADARAFLEGCAAVHAAGIIHRDIKPDNVLRMADGRLVVSDFGLALPEDSAQRTVVGTAGYKAPEVLAELPASKASDVWSIGVTLHEIAFRRRPVWAFKDGRQIFTPSLTPGGFAALCGIEALCAECFDHEPSRRPADAGTLLRRFDDVVSGRRQRQRRSRRAASLVAGTAVAAALVVAVATDLPHRLGFVSRVGAATATSAAARSTAPGAATAGTPLPMLQPTGEPADWSKTSRVLANLPGKVHCLTALPGEKTLRIVWGEPRKAEDVDVATGARHEADLVPAAFAQSCPQLASDGKRLLYSTLDKRGAYQVMLSPHPDGRDAETVSPGYGPLWRGQGDDVVFGLDARHVGLLSPGRATPLVLQDVGDNIVAGVEDRSVVQGGDAVLSRVIDASFNTTLLVHGLPSFDTKLRVKLPGPSRALSPMPDGSYGTIIRVGGRWTVVGVDPSGESAHAFGFISSPSLRRLHALADGSFALVAGDERRLVWLIGPDGARTLLPADGRAAAPDVSPEGDVLAAVRVEGGGAIGLYRKRDGYALHLLTHGNMDSAPSFLPDGSGWLQISIDGPLWKLLRCRFSDGNCTLVPFERGAVGWPVMAPSGTQLAYVSTPDGHVFVSNADGTSPRDLGTGQGDCRPRWLSDDRLWVLRGPDERLQWVEIDVPRGLPTGRQLAAKGCYDLVPARAGLLGVVEVKEFTSELRWQAPTH